MRAYFILLLLFFCLSVSSLLVKADTTLPGQTFTLRSFYGVRKSTTTSKSSHVMNVASMLSRHYEQLQDDAFLTHPLTEAYRAVPHGEKYLLENIYENEAVMAEHRENESALLYKNWRIPGIQMRKITDPVCVCVCVCVCTCVYA